MMIVVRQILTGIDNTTHDIGRWMAAASSVTALGLQIYDTVWRGRPFDIQAFGIGCAALAVGAGAFLKLKADTEPGAPVGQSTVDVVQTTTSTHVEASP